MKGKPFRDQDNRALHERRMKERTRIVVTQKNIEYILAHQHDSREELARYLRQCKKELGHVPAHSLSKKSGWSWAFSDRYGRVGKGDARCWNAGKWIEIW